MEVEVDELQWAVVDEKVEVEEVLLALEMVRYDEALASWVASLRVELLSPRMLAAAYLYWGTTAGRLPEDHVVGHGRQ